MKKNSTYRTCDAEENRLYVDGFALSRCLVRSDGNLKKRLFLIKNALFEGDKVRSLIGSSLRMRGKVFEDNHSI